MLVSEFITLWRFKTDTDGSHAAGIAINWDKISPDDSFVEQFFGQGAWNKIGDFYAPVWGGFDRTILRDWLQTDRHDYANFIEGERSKISFYDKNGLPKGYREFCAFLDSSGSFGVLGDGSHRYIDCNYLISQGRDLSADIAKCRLDILCVGDITKVLTPIDMPPNQRPT